MGHGIFNQKRDFQIAETMAWHRLTRLGKPQREDFPEITERPLFYGENLGANYGGKNFVIPVSTDDELPVAPPYCNSTYSLFKPREAWDWVNGILEGTKFNIASIGMLWNRSFWFLGVKLTELNALTVGDGRKSEFGFNFSGGLDRKVSPQAELSSILPVCHNTISLSRATGNILFKEKATKNFVARRDIAAMEIERAIGMTAVFKAAMDSLAEKACSPNRAEKIFTGYLTDEKTEKLSTNTKNSVEELVKLHVSGRGNKGETEFDLLNAFTERHTYGPSDSSVSLGKRFASGEFGSSMDEKATFTRLLTTERDGTENRESLATIERRGEHLLLTS